jgi:hypothetical protein
VMDWSTCPMHDPAPDEGGIVVHIEDVEEGLAIVGLLWAMRLWLEREDAFTRGRECEAECWSCVYTDCGHRRAPGCE